MRLSVCIATYRRADRLSAVLDDLARQTLLPDQVVAAVAGHAGLEQRPGIRPPLARHRAAAWLITAGANLGKLSVFLGWKYRAYT